MTIQHTFKLLPDEVPERDWESQVHTDADVELHDGVMQYLYPILIGTPFRPPGRVVRLDGLAMYGVTAIRGPSAARFAALLRLYAGAFALGPERIKVGDWEHPPSFDRDELVSRLEALAAMCDQAARGPFWIIHGGI